MPVPTPSGVSVISIGMLKPRRDQVVAWRGPMLDRALVQMLADVYWGDLDVLLLDLPPGTGDVAISLGQHLPNAEVIVVTTPQEAATEVAERAGTMASMMHQRVDRRRREHVLPRLPALRRGGPGAPAGDLRHRRRRPGRGHAEPAASATTSRCSAQIPLDTAPARGRRRRQADRRRRPDRPGRARAGAGRATRSPSAAAGWPACSSGSRPSAPVGLVDRVRRRRCPRWRCIAPGGRHRVRPRPAARHRAPGRPDGPPAPQLRRRRPAASSATSSAPSTPTSSSRDLDPRVAVRKHILEAMDEDDLDAHRSGRPEPRPAR